jgi:transposase-like protein
MAWYVAYPIGYRQLEEMMKEHGVSVDHSTLNRWVLKYAPELEKQFRARPRPVGKSCVSTRRTGASDSLMRQIVIFYRGR